MTKQKIEWLSDAYKSLTYTAMCIWEELITNDSPDAPWVEWRNINGTASLRDAAAELAVYAEALWESLPGHEKDDLIFDWEWIPGWLALCVDWSDASGWPRVIAGAKP